MNSKMQNKYGTILNICYVLKIAWKCVPSYIIWEMLYGIFMGLWGSVAIVFTQVFYENLFGDTDFYKILRILSFMLTITVVFHLWIQWYLNVYKPQKKQLLNYKVNKILFRKNIELDVNCYNNPEFYNDFVWAMSECDTQIIGVIESISNTFQHIIALLISSGVMASVSPILSIIAILTSVIHIVLQNFWIKSDLERRTALNPLNRKNSYYEHLYNTPDYAKEIRISHVSDIIFDKYIENLKQIKDTHIKYNTKILKYIIPFNLMSGIMQPIVYGILFYQIIVLKTLSIASLAIAFSVFWALRYRIQNVIDLIMRYHQHGLYIERIRKYMEYKSDICSGFLAAPEFKSIELKNVSFGYHSEKTVLNNVNMVINKGEKIAIVGYNGAGKSTLVNLILHLYNPDEGIILYNGKNINEYDVNSFRLRVGVVFQDYRIFALSLAENVICDIYRNELDEDRVMNALKNACFEQKLYILPNGINSELTKEFYSDGFNLSGGESQKIALSRIFSYPYDLIIMDEPSASLDPQSEYELNKNIKKYAKDKTVVIISHRLSTTCDMDRIYMFENGAIVERGTHSELLEKEGKYAYIFNLQADKYK